MRAFLSLRDTCAIFSSWFFHKLRHRPTSKELISDNRSEKKKINSTLIIILIPQLLFHNNIYITQNKFISFVFVDKYSDKCK